MSWRSDEDPFYGNHGDDEETLHDRRQDVLIADHAAIEEAQARCHDEYQGGADEDPGRIACIDRPRIGSEGCRRCHEQTTGAALLNVTIIFFIFPNLLTKKKDAFPDGNHQEKDIIVYCHILLSPEYTKSPGRQGYCPLGLLCRQYSVDGTII